MDQHNQDIKSLEAQISELRSQLYEANNTIDAIREGAVDALVLHHDGTPQVYSLQSADYTYRILIEKFGEGALSINAEGLILYCNDYFAQLAGKPLNKIVGTHLQDYLESPAEFSNLIARLTNGISKGEVVIKNQHRHISVYMSLSDLSPTVAAIGVVVTDLTEKKKHEEALIQYQQRLETKINELNLSNSSLEQFIHVISHDIKEPLRKILTYTSHLIESGGEELQKKQIANLNVINSSALRLNSLVDDLVKYAFSATKEEMKKIDLRAIIDDVKDDLELIIKENEAQIIVENLPVINGSRVQLRQLFSNLISNALKYRKITLPPSIVITCAVVSGIDPLSPQRKYNKISFKDNGIGIEEKHLTKIFTIFQRLHMRNEYSGNGIGLAICKKIMENHSGTIDVQSVVNDGSIFNLYFPLEK